MTGRPGYGQWKWLEEVPGRTSLAPLASPCFVLCLIGVETEGLLDYQGRAGIISIARWNLRPVIFGAELRASQLLERQWRDWSWRSRPSLKRAGTDWTVHRRSSQGSRSERPALPFIQRAFFRHQLRTPTPQAAQNLLNDASLSYSVSAENSPINLISEANLAAKAPHQFPVSALENAAFSGKIASLTRKSRGPKSPH